MGCSRQCGTGSRAPATPEFEFDCAACVGGLSFAFVDGVWRRFPRQRYSGSQAVWTCDRCHDPESCVQIGGEQERGMADHSGDVVSGEASRLALATSRTTEQPTEDDQETSPGRGGLVLVALGVVFGDIGTSPVY